MSHGGCHSKVQRQVQLKRSTGQIPFLDPREQREKRKWDKSCVVSSPCVDASLVSSPPLPLYRAGSQLRLLLSVWRAGCENVAATSICVCVSERESVCFSQCMCASPSSKAPGRQRTSALNSPLTPPLLPSLPLSVPPLPSPLLSADINTQGTAAKIPGKVVKILGGYWIERERVKRQQTFLSVEFTRSKLPLFLLDARWSVQVLVDPRNIKGHLESEKKLDRWKNRKLFFIPFHLYREKPWRLTSGGSDLEWIWRTKGGQNVHSDPGNFITDL